MKGTEPFILIPTLIVSLLSTSIVFAQTRAPQPLFTPPQQAPEIVETPLPVEEVPHNIEIRIENNSVYMKAVNATLKEILTALAKEGGFEVSVSSYSSKISTTIEGLSVEETIHRLMKILQEGNYHIYYDEKGSIKRVEVFSVPEAPSTNIPQRPVTPRFRRPQTPSPQMPQPPELIQPPQSVIPHEEEDQ